MAREHPECTANRGFHRTPRANLECPYHRAIALANNPKLDVSKVKNANWAPYGVLSTLPPTDRVIVVDLPESTTRGRVVRRLLGDLEHCEDGPAVEFYWPGEDGGLIRTRHYRRYGDPVSCDEQGGPTLIYYETDGQPSYWTWEGEIGEERAKIDLHTREYSDGRREWTRAGESHRGGGRPQTVGPDGFGIRWCEDGRHHRVTGPATVGREDRYFIAGEPRSRDEVWALFLERFGVHRDNAAAQRALWVEPADPERTFVAPTEAAVALFLGVHRNPGDASPGR